jgi:hypothetical protein
MQSFKVKSISGGNFDRQSRKNLRELVRFVRKNGSIVIWVATDAPFDASIAAGTPQFEQQSSAVSKFHEKILRRINLTLENADSTSGGPYFAIDASEKELRKLLVIDGVKGYWGLIGPARMTPE